MDINNKLNTDILPSVESPQIESVLDPVIERRAVNPIPEINNQSNFCIEHTDASIVKAYILGFITSIVCVILWLFVNLLLDRQISIFSIITGFIIGFSVQKYGKGTTPAFGICGVLLIIFTNITQHYISFKLWISTITNDTLLKEFSFKDYLVENTNYADLLFYFIAILIAYAFPIIRKK